MLPSGNEALAAKIDELRTSGWNVIKVGIRPTKAFAEAFLQRRIDTVIVPEPAKSEIPRKAKVAKQDYQTVENECFNGEETKGTEERGHQQWFLAPLSSPL